MSTLWDQVPERADEDEARLYAQAPRGRLELAMRVWAAQRTQEV